MKIQTDKPHTFPLSRVRDDTPGLNHVIHFNNAGASLMPEPVLQTVRHYLDSEAKYGGYETASKYREELESTYTAIASLIHAESSEIALMENATAAWNMAFYAIPFEQGDRILTSESEYASNYINFLHLQKRSGLELSVEVIPSDEKGQTAPEALEQMMDERVKLVALTHIPTNSGLVNPAEQIGHIIQDYDCFYLLDACQSAGHYPLDVRKIGCDMLSATGRKYLRGPRGTGFLYVNQKVLDNLVPPFLDLHSAEWKDIDRYEMRGDARRFENWESNYAGIIGLKKAAQYALDLGMDAIWNRIRSLADLLRGKLSQLPGVGVHDIGTVKGGIVTFTVAGITAEEVQGYLAQRHINVSVTTRSSTLIDMQKRNLRSLVRASIHYYNTEEEIDRMVSVLKEL